MRRNNGSPRVRLASLMVVFALGSSDPGEARAQAGVDQLERGDARPLTGRFLGDIKSGFRFVPADGSGAIVIDGPAEIRLGGTGPVPNAGVPTVRAILGLDQSVSGQLDGVDAATIRLIDGPSGHPVAVDRRGAIALRQRSGEALVLIEGFETLDPARWSHVGTPTLDTATKLAGEKSLKIAADGTAVTTVTPAPVVQGRVEVAFHDAGTIAAGAQWFVDLLFKGEHGPESLRAVLGWSEESHAVQSSGGPALAVQRLARKPGWHRLEIRFGPDAAEMAIDGDALAHGRGPSGPLIEVRIGSSLASPKSPEGLASHVDELRIVRLAAAPATGEADPAQDEVRLIEGDQVFGTIRAADPRRVVMQVLGRDVSVPWSEIADLHFRRDPRPSRWVEGLLGRLEWRAAPGDDARDLDRAEGAIVAADDQSITLETAYAGRLVVPRDRVRRASIVGMGRRLVLDPTAHHLGDEVSRAPEWLDPPQPEGGTLERRFKLDKAPAPGEAASLVLDVVQVVGEANGLQFSHLIRQGELRTKVALNGVDFDYLNRHISTRNDVPERIRLPIPAGRLKAGENVVRIVQTGTAKDPTYLDDLGVLGMAVEVGPAPRPEIQP